MPLVSCNFLKCILCRQREAVATFKKRSFCAEKPPEVVQVMYFGSLIWAIGTKTKQYINNYLHAKWVAPSDLRYAWVNWSINWRSAWPTATCS